MARDLAVAPALGRRLLHVDHHRHELASVHAQLALACGATVRGACTHSARGPGGKPPCASGTCPAQKAGTRSPYVPNGGPGAYASAQALADSLEVAQHVREEERGLGAAGVGVEVAIVDAESRLARSQRVVHRSCHHAV